MTTTSTTLSMSSAWAEAYRLYEDVCILCATLLMGIGGGTGGSGAANWKGNLNYANSNSNWNARIGGSGSGEPPSTPISSPPLATEEMTRWGKGRSDSEGGGGDEDKDKDGDKDGDGDGDGGGDWTHMRVLGKGIEGRGIGGTIGSGGKNTDSNPLVALASASASASGRDDEEELGSMPTLLMRSRGQGIEGKPLMSKSSAESQVQQQQHQQQKEKKHVRKLSASSVYSFKALGL